MSKRIGELSLSPAQKDKLFELMAGDFRCGRRFFASSPRNRMFLSHDDHFLPFLVCRKKATMMMATGRGRVRLFFSRLTFRAEDVVCTSTRFFRCKYLDWGFFLRGGWYFSNATIAINLFGCRFNGFVMVFLGYAWKSLEKLARSVSVLRFLLRESFSILNFDNVFFFFFNNVRNIICIRYHLFIYLELSIFQCV